VAEVGVVHDQAGALAVEDLGQRLGRAAGVEVEDVGAALGQRDGALDQAAAVAGEQAGGVALAQPAGAQLAGEPVGAHVHLAPGQRALVVDEREAVRVAGGAGGVAGRGRDAPAGCGQGHPDQPVRADRGEQAGTGEDPHSGDVDQADLRVGSTDHGATWPRHGRNRAVCLPARAAQVTLHRARPDPARVRAAR
jgi:hypothetical protein